MAEGRNNSVTAEVAKVAEARRHHSIRETFQINRFLAAVLLAAVLLGFALRQAPLFLCDLCDLCGEMFFGFPALKTTYRWRHHEGW